MVETILVFAQADPISGGAGWVGAGLLGLVLGWLLLKHLPDKDKQVKALIDTHNTQLGIKDAQMLEAAKCHSQAIKDVVKHCQDEVTKQRSASEVSTAEQVKLLRSVYESTRENIHTTRNLGSTIINRAFLADAFQSVEVPAWTKSTDGVILSWNPAAERVLGWKQSEIVGKSIYQLVPADRRQEEANVLKQVGEGTHLEEYETDRMAKSGERVHMLVTTSPIRDYTGRLVGVSTMARLANA